MVDTRSFWNLSGLSNAALLGGLSRLVGSGRRLLAEVIAHLAEVEERRLHLDSGYGSMFAYCVSRLGLSEDEACRRIEAARIARRHPAIYPLLASGQLSLSVIALLKPHLEDTHSKDLFDLVSGKSVSHARELLAARFPRPDVPSRIRKLPTSQPVPGRTDEDKHAAPQPLPLSGAYQAHAMPTPPPAATAPEPASSFNPQPPNHQPHSDTPHSAPLRSPPPEPPVHDVPPVRPSRASRAIEPLSAARFRIQLTADAALKDKLVLARDLMRHTIPDGDFAPILSRALDLLIEQLMKRRFGARGKHPAAAHSNHDGPKGAPADEPVITHASTTQSSNTAPDAYPPPDPVPVLPSTETNPRRAAACAPPPAARQPAPSSPAASRKTAPEPRPGKTIARSTRRIVSERDGLRCTWQSPDGRRCESRAWLENDHADPRARGVGSEPENIRLLCRAHNQRAAELHYGRGHMTDAITRAQKRRSPAPAPAPSP